MVSPYDRSVAPIQVRSQLRVLSRPSDKAPVRQRTPKRPRYVLTMSPGKDRETPNQNPEWTPERARALSRWIESVFELFLEQLEWSRSRVITEAKVSRSAVYRWRDPSGKGTFPDPALLDRFCANLYEKLPSPLLDPAVPYGILGRGKPGLLAAARVEALMKARPTDLEGKVRRARIVLEGRSLTPAQRERYEAMLADFETAYERVIDTIIADLEPENSVAGEKPERDE